MRNRIGLKLAVAAVGTVLIGGCSGQSGEPVSANAPITSASESVTDEAPDDCILYEGPNLTMAEWNSQAASVASRFAEIAAKYNMPPAYEHEAVMPPNTEAAETILREMPEGGLARYSKFFCEQEAAPAVLEARVAATSTQNAPASSGLDYLGYLRELDQVSRDYPGYNTLFGAGSCILMKSMGMTSSQIGHVQRQSLDDGRAVNIDDDYARTVVEYLCPQLS